MMIGERPRRSYFRNTRAKATVRIRRWADAREREGYLASFEHFCQCQHQRIARTHQAEEAPREYFEEDLEKRLLMAEAELEVRK